MFHKGLNLSLALTDYPAIKFYDEDFQVPCIKTEDVSASLYTYIALSSLFNFTLEVLP